LPFEYIRKNILSNARVVSIVHNTTKLASRTSSGIYLVRDSTKKPEEKIREGVWKVTDILHRKLSHVPYIKYLKKDVLAAECIRLS